MDPRATALAFTRACLQHSAEYAEQLEPLATAQAADDGELARTALFRRALRLTEFAIRGVSPGVTLEKLTAPLQIFTSGPLGERVRLADVAKAVDTTQGDNAAMAIVLAAATAREKLADGESLTASELALLSGMSRIGILGAKDRGQLTPSREGKPGHRDGTFMFSASESRRWLKERDDRE